MAIPVAHETLSGVPRRSARPSRLTEDLAQAIYERLHRGLPIHAICEDPAMPSRSNFYRWRAQHLAFDQQVAHLLRERPQVQRRHPIQGPIGYTPELAARIVARLAAGESQKSIGRDPAMPCVMTILRWAREFPDFAAARAQALKAPRRPPPRRYASTAPARLEEVCFRLLHGAPLTQVCASPDVPSERSVYRHARLNPEFRRALDLARDTGDWLLAERMWQRMQALSPDDEAGVRAAEREAGKVRRQRGRRD